MYRLILSDGTEFNARFCSAIDGILTLSIFSENDFAYIAEQFLDSEKTARITFRYGTSQDVFDDYTDLRLINHATNGEYIISLKKV